MVKIVDYGTYIIDLADAMIDHQQGLTQQHIARLSVIRDRSVRFVTSCIQHENADLETLYHFLDGEAMQSIMIVISYSEFLMMDEALHPAYRDGIERMKECGFSIREELNQMKDDLVAFMNKIGVSVPQSTQSVAKGKKQIKRLKPKTGLQVDYLDDAVPPEPARKPIQKLQPQMQVTGQGKVRRIQRVEPSHSGRNKIRTLHA